MKPKQMAKPSAPASPPDAVKKLASKPNVARNKAQVDAILRSKKQGQREAISARTAAAREARSPAAMIAALHDIRPLGHQIATPGPGKAGWDKTIDGAIRAWEAVQIQPGKSPVTGPAAGGGSKGADPGMPKHTNGGGSAMDTGFIDICKVPAPPAPYAPVPYPSPKTIEHAKQAGADAGHAAEGAADAAGNAADDAADAAHGAADAAGNAADDAADAAHDAADAGAGAAHDAADSAQDAGTNAANTASSWLPH